MATSEVKDLVSNQVPQHLENNDILTSYQSTGHIFLLLVLNHSKALGTVDHNNLCDNLQFVHKLSSCMDVYHRV